MAVLGPGENGHPFQAPGGCSPAFRQGQASRFRHEMEGDFTW